MKSEVTMTLAEIISQRAPLDEAFCEMFEGFPAIDSDRCNSLEAFAAIIHEQTQFLVANDRIALIKEQFSLSQKNSELQDYQKKINELKASIKSRDQRIDADARILRQHRENESTLKQLKREIATLQIEKNKDLQN